MTVDRRIARGGRFPNQGAASLGRTRLLIEVDPWPTFWNLWSDSSPLRSAKPMVRSLRCAPRRRLRARRLRCEAYYDVAASAVLVHSKRKHGEEALNVPLALGWSLSRGLVPTTYSQHAR